MGLGLLVRKKRPWTSCHTVHALMIPSGVDDAKLSESLALQFNSTLDISGDFGSVKVKIWLCGG